VGAVGAVGAAGGAGAAPTNQRRRGIPLIGVDNLPGSIPLETYDLPRECVLVFGQEGPGLSPEMRQACEVVLHIEQFGSTRSINAGAAAAIAMHAWVRRNHFEQIIVGQVVD
jgi:tRNA G18 (ribose-2'-O)-methylase SpoU